MVFHGKFGVFNLRVCGGGGMGGEILWGRGVHGSGLIGAWHLYQGQFQGVVTGSVPQCETRVMFA